MDTVLLLTLADPPPATGGCGACGAACLAGSGPVGSGPVGGAAAGGEPADACPPAGPPLRAAVLACRDALTAEGLTVDVVTATSDAEIDAALARLDGPPRADGLRWPAPDGATGLVVAADVDGQLRAVLRRMVRRYAPPPSRRPADLATGRTLPDLPALAVLPTRREPAAPYPDLVDRLGLPRDPADVAKALLHGDVRRLDLLRNDGGSVTLHGALFGGEALWRARIDVDDARLAGPHEQIVACAVANADGYAHAGALPLAPDADPADGLVNVAVAVPVTVRGRFGRRQQRLEVRRAHGRAVAVEPVDAVDFLDDGVSGALTRKRSWWIEAGAWGVYRSPSA